MEKKCSSCNEIKNVSEFHRKSETTYNGNCKSCAIKIAKEWYKKNKNKKHVKERLTKADFIRLARFKTLIVNIKEKVGGCCLCDECDPCCLDFHHVHSKEKDISSFVKGKSLKGIYKELKKCVCICSNCHRKVHAGKLKIKTNTIELSWDDLVLMFENCP